MSKKLIAVLITLGIFVLLVLIAVGTFASSYNRLVTLNENINNSWAQVQTVMQRRADLIPNLVNTVKGYAKHEKAIFDHVADATAKLAGATTPKDKFAANDQLDGALSRLLMVVQNYPNLKANKSFNRLMDELAGTENRIAVERRRYNNAVMAYNVAVKSFPTNIIAGMFGYAPKEVYFKATENANKVPTVKF
ncbi:MAG: LemA family protein [Deltaproteobacteria bacterium]|nr:LemA family protein [Deltaproteobacteria bacterium]MCL5792628.1 LemA family protein [Deltaproteobacteria bacterium]